MRKRRSGSKKEMRGGKENIELKYHRKSFSLPSSNHIAHTQASPLQKNREEEGPGYEASNCILLYTSLLDS